ncbi:MAG: hypothetical protein EBR82_07930 [Caulobacteraceae bacterium]|nr:hypothetical protein [Caulobacteraceae bacterium]
MTKKKSGASKETARQRAYHQRVVDEGGKRVVLLLKKDEAEALAEAAALHGGQKEVLLKGMEALRSRANDLTQDQVIDWIKRNT